MPDPPIMPRTAFVMDFPSPQAIVTEPPQTGKGEVSAALERIFARSRFGREYAWLPESGNRPIRMPVPPPALARNPERDIASNARSVLNSVFGLPAFRGAQEEIVRHVTEGGNCLVLMPTGGGKSLCYQLPSLLRKGCGIVVSPLIALMRDQVAGLLEAGVRAAGSAQ